VDHLKRRLTLDGFELRRAGQRHWLFRTAPEATAASALRAKIEAFDLDSVQRDFDRALAEGDPEDAITSACSTVESVCKCLLDLMGQPHPAKQDIQGLVREVSRHLNLSPERTDIGQDIKQILGGLAGVAGGIGALRTHAATPTAGVRAPPKWTPGSPGWPSTPPAPSRCSSAADGLEQGAGWAACSALIRAASDGAKPVALDT
jgi:hypothetical protein